jgi:hypothetical protein
MDCARHRRWIGVAILLVVLSLQPACLFSKKSRIGTTALLVGDVAKAAAKQSDLRMIREGLPAYLMLIDGMIEGWPDKAELLIAAAQAYSSFGAVLGDDQDKDYTNLLAVKSRSYALRALILRGFKDPLKSSFDDFTKDVAACGKKDVPYIFWAATCWTNWIMLNLDSMEAMAELPRVELLVRKALEIDEGFYYGGPHLFMGVWFAARPAIAGGDLQKAKGHFLKAMELGEDKFLMASVYYADNYARRAQDKELFVSTLEKVLKSPADSVPELTLLNTVAKKKAKALLNRVDEYFE